MQKTGKIRQALHKLIMIMKLKFKVHRQVTETHEREIEKEGNVQ